jgi:hypothetical protein
MKTLMADMPITLTEADGWLKAGGWRRHEFVFL